MDIYFEINRMFGAANPSNPLRQGGEPPERFAGMTTIKKMKFYNIHG